jgi:small subunit ribosomal protein S2
MSKVTMRELLAVGAHFGHQKRYLNPQMKDYIYGVRNKIHIVDLQQTLPMFEEALNFIGQIVAGGGNILFVGTKKATGQIIKEQAMRCDMPFVSHRWLGGMLTNFKTIKQSIKRLKELEVASQDGSFNLITKKEALMRTRELEKLNLSLGGIKDMQGMPDAIFVIDVKHEKIALKEAKLLTKKIPVIAVVDTNCSTDGVDYIVPGNDDAFRAVRLYASAVADAVIESRTSGHNAFYEEEAEVTEVAPPTTQEEVQENIPAEEAVTEEEAKVTEVAPPTTQEEVQENIPAEEAVIEEEKAVEATDSTESVEEAEGENKNT